MEVKEESQACNDNCDNSDAREHKQDCDCKDVFIDDHDTKHFIFKQENQDHFCEWDHQNGEEFKNELNGAKHNDKRNHSSNGGLESVAVGELKYEKSETVCVKSQDLDCKIEIINHNLPQKIEDNMISRQSGGTSFNCDSCDYRTTQKSKLEQHIWLKHRLQTPFKCNSCDYKAATRSKLSLHRLLEHGKEKPFKCYLCNYSTVRKHSLSVHISAKHCREKNFKCLSCNYCTAWKISLSRHMILKHGKRKPFKCNLCSYSSVVKNVLLQHIMLKHIGERPFKCNLCDFSAVQKQELIYHVGAKHSEPLSEYDTYM